MTAISSKSAAMSASIWQTEKTGHNNHRKHLGINDAMLSLKSGLNASKPTSMMLRPVKCCRHKPQCNQHVHACTPADNGSNQDKPANTGVYIATGAYISKIAF